MPMCVKTVLMVCGLSAWLLPSFAYAGDGDAVRRGLEERLRVSRMEVANSALEGYVFKPRAVLVLRSDGARAKKLRIVQANTKSPRFHVPDYTEVTVARDGSLTAGSGDFPLPKGTRLVVLDLKVEKDRVRVFTHTLRPVPLPGGKTAHGCAEFIFPLDATIRDRSDVATVATQIDRVLSLTTTNG